MTILSRDLAKTLSQHFTLKLRKKNPAGLRNILARGFDPLQNFAPECFDIFLFKKQGPGYFYN